MHCGTLLQKTVHIRQYIALLFYIILWYKQKCVTGSIMKNIKVYCLINIRSYFVIIFKTYIYFNTSMNKEGGGIMVWQKAALPMSWYIVQETYHQEHATEPSRLQVTPTWPLGRCNIKFRWRCHSA